MANFGKYLRQILQNKENVILPGFGSLKVVKSAGADDSNGKLHPPGLSIKFDAEHPKDDGKLAALYAKEEGLDPEEARQQVLELVDAIKFKLDKGESFYLEDLGEFSRDDDNRIHFAKSAAWVLDPESFGLETLELLELEDESDLQGTAEYSEEEVEKSVELPVEDNMNQVNTKEKSPVNKWKIIWIVVGGLIVVLVTLLLIPTGNEDIEFSKEGIVIHDEDSKDSETPEAEQLQNNAEVENNTEIENDQPEKEEPADQISPEETEAKYYIISGSFQNLINASEMKDKLTSKGFPAEIIYTENRLYRVSIQSYTSIGAANTDLQRVRRESGVDKAWILAR